MLSYFRLLRIPNLLMIPFTMYLLRYGIVEPALKYGYSINLSENIELAFSDKLFFIVVLINMFLGAAGYVINDYFDRKIDSINRPNKVVIGKKIHRRTAIALHIVLNAIALILSLYLSWKTRNIMIFVVYLALSGIFWLYSTNYKKQFLIGNVVVSLLTALVPLQVAYFDIIALNTEYTDVLISQNVNFKVLMYWLLAFSVFAFFTNFVREIVKDMEDYEGDVNYQCNSLPIVWGIGISKTIVVGIFLIIITLLSFVYFKFLLDPISKWYLLSTIVIPLLICIYMIIKAKTSKNYHVTSIILKIIMLLGVLYSLVARYIMTNV